MLIIEAQKIPSARAAAHLRFAQNTEGLIVDTVSKGVIPLVGGPGFVSPAATRPIIPTSVTEDIRLFDKESFGPSFSLYIVKDEEDAVKLANNSKYSLSATIHTKDMYRFI